MEDHNRKTMEVLAPAGSLQAFHAAVNAGADAVYCGGTRFGARAYADNFTEEELLRAIDYAHLSGVKVYLTVNTCLKNKELEEVPGYLLPYYEAGLDAVLVQDFGVLTLIRETFPDLPVHASTQMNITSVQGAQFVRGLGLQRVVLARELSCPEIRAIHEGSDIELECFVHGALCYSYSGQCLMSSLLGGRSGNRGRCAGTCRLPYQLKPDGKPCYPLSLKDLCAAYELPALKEAGVRSLKIEGRMKSPGYTAGVTAIYRELVDLLDEKGTEAYRVPPECMTRLLALGNRSGFTKGFLEVHNDPGMLTMDSPSHRSEKGGAETEGNDLFRIQKKLPIKGEAVFHAAQQMRLTVGVAGWSVTETGACCEKAANRATTEKELREKLLATGDTEFAFAALSITADHDVFVPMKAVKELRRNALRKLSDEILRSNRREWTKKEVSGAAPGESGSGPKPVMQKKAYNARVPSVAALVSTRDQLEAVLGADRVSTVILDSFLYDRSSFPARLSEDIAAVHNKGKKAVYGLPYIFRLENSSFYESCRTGFCSLSLDGYLVRDYDGLALLRSFSCPADKIRLDASLYTYSDKAADAFSSLGYLHQTLPMELNERELLHRGAAFSSWIIYGRLPLMVSANCVRKTASGCDRKKTAAVLIDRRKKVFPVRCDCTDCTNLILNADILDLRGEKVLMERLCPEEIRFQFTMESREETENLLREDILWQDDKKQYTRGLLKRGVE